MMARLFAKVCSHFNYTGQNSLISSNDRLIGCGWKRPLQTLRAITLLVGVSIVHINSADAATVLGRITFVGTEHELVQDGNHSATFRIRMSDSTCTGDNQKKERWIKVLSGRMDGKYQHNMANFMNAYNTAMSAFGSGKDVQVDQVPSCTTEGTQTIELWRATIGIYK
jgi:hypothetical protein